MNGSWRFESLRTESVICLWVREKTGGKRTDLETGQWHLVVGPVFNRTAPVGNRCHCEGGWKQPPPWFFLC